MIYQFSFACICAYRLSVYSLGEAEKGVWLVGPSDFYSRHGIFPNLDPQPSSNYLYKQIKLMKGSYPIEGDGPTFGL